MAKEPHPDAGQVIALIDCPSCGNPHVKVKLNKNGRAYWKCAPNVSGKCCFAEFNYPPLNTSHYDEFLANDRQPVDRRTPKKDDKSLRNVEVGGKRFGFC